MDTSVQTERRASHGALRSLNRSRALYQSTRLLPSGVSESSQRLSGSAGAAPSQVSWLDKITMQVGAADLRDASIRTCSPHQSRSARDRP
jgi:hypothetical protein